MMEVLTLILNSKRGAFFDTVFFFLVIVVLIIGGIFLMKIIGPITTAFTGSSMLTDTAKTAMIPAQNSSVVYDNIFLIVFVVLWIAVLVAAYQIDSHPLFFIILTVIMILLVLASGLIGQMIANLLGDPLLSSTTSNMPIVNFVANHLFMIIIVIGFSVMIVMFSKRSGGNGQ